MTHPNQNLKMLNVSQDVTLYSFPKCGRTWLRYIFMYLFNEHLAAEHKILPEHAKKKKIILIRDIRDVLVSYYFELTKREGFGAIDPNEKEKLAKKWQKSDQTLSALIHIGTIDTFMKFYKTCYKTKGEKLLMRYEALHQDTYTEILRMTRFLNRDAQESNIREAIEKASFQNMRKMEASGSGIPGIQHMGTWLPNLTPKDPGDTDTYKTRSGKVGGYEEHLSETDIEFVNKQIRKKYRQLLSVYGYEA